METGSLKAKITLGGGIGYLSRKAGLTIDSLVGEMSVSAMNSMFDAVYPKGMQWYWKAHYVSELTEEAIETNIKHAARIPSLLSTMHYYPIDGRVHDLKEEETAWYNRDKRWIQLIVGIDPDPANKERITHWSRQYYDAMAPFARHGAYINFMMKEADENVKAAFGNNYQRLVKVKKKYDPENFFHVNQNIRP